jgi:precorrin-3B synthase
VLRGCCPSVFAPMPSGDGLLARVKPPSARLPAAAARQLAAAAARFGNGAIELTSRAAIQVRGLRMRDAAAFAAAMVSAGLADADPEVERRRAVIAAPLLGVDPGASPDADELAAAIEAVLARDPRLASLPPKFRVSVDGGGVLPLGDVGADIRVVCENGRSLVAIESVGVIGSMTEAVEAVARIAFAFRELSGQCSPMPRRMRGLVAAVGAPRVFAAARLDGRAGQVDAPFHRRPTVGWTPYADGERGAFGLGMPFGVTDAAAFAGLVDLAERFGDSTLCVTPWCAYVLAHVLARDAAGLRDAGVAMGLIVDAGDPRLRLSACVGKPGCASASVDARADAMRLLSPLLRASVHVAGCAKGCAHPGMADFTLVGEAGRYGLVRDGRAGDAPPHQGLTIEEAAALLRGDPP